MRIEVGDIAHMKKQHPCGSLEWEVTRIGADIGIRCKKCGRRVMLTREEFGKRLKNLEQRGSDRSDMSDRSDPR